MAALRAHVQSASLNELRVRLDSDGYSPQPSDREEALYRIVREALHNVIKHARATEAVVRVRSTRDAVIVTVRDDGVGFTIDARTTTSGRFRAAYGLGLLSMRERASEHGGACRIESEPGRGTLVEITLPLADEGTP